MRLPRLRVSVRAMMILVAIVAAGLGYVHHRRASAFRRHAAAHAAKANDQSEAVKQCQEIWERMDSLLGYGAAYFARRERISADTGDGWEAIVDSLKGELDQKRALFDYEKGLEHKYRRAAAYPWLPIAPDPPPPVPILRTASAPTAGRREEVRPDLMAVVASLPKGVFDLQEPLTLREAIPLTIEYRNRSDRPITVCAISRVIVTDVDDNEAELTSQGRSHQQAAASPPGETRRRHSTVVIEPGGSFRDEGLDLTGLYRLPPGRYSVRVIHDDTPPGVISDSVPFWVRRPRQHR